MRKYRLLPLLILLQLPTLGSATPRAAAKSNCALALDPAKKLVIEVTAQEVNGKNTNSGASFPTRLVKLQAEAHELFLHELKPIFLAPNADVTFSITLPDGKSSEVNLPREMNERLVSYLINGGEPTSPFDCNCFAHYFNGVEYVFGTFRSELWSINPLSSESDLAVGDTIIIGYSLNRITHLAIFIGNGLYLSKFGSNGPLIVSDLNAMKIGFGGKKAFSARPL